MRSGKVLGDMRGDAEKGKGEGKRQRGMQKAAEIFVEFGECHGIIPLWIRRYRRGFRSGDG